MQKKIIREYDYVRAVTTLLVILTRVRHKKFMR